MPNLLCEWFFPQCWPLETSYRWVHDSRRDWMADYAWHRIRYEPVFIDKKYQHSVISVQFANINPYE